LKAVCKKNRVLSVVAVRKKDQYCTIKYRYARYIPKHKRLILRFLEAILTRFCTINARRNFFGALKNEMETTFKKIIHTNTSN
jgi:hypothetical protein